MEQRCPPARPARVRPGVGHTTHHLRRMGGRTLGASLQLAMFSAAFVDSARLDGPERAINVDVLSHTSEHQQDDNRERQRERTAHLVRQRVLLPRLRPRCVRDALEADDTNGGSGPLPRPTHRLGGRVRLSHRPHRARYDRPAGREVGAGEKTSQRFGRIYVLVNNARYANVSAVETLKNSC